MPDNREENKKYNEFVAYYINKQINEPEENDKLLGELVDKTNADNYINSHLFNKQWKDALKKMNESAQSFVNNIKKAASNYETDKGKASKAFKDAYNSYLLFNKQRLAFSEMTENLEEANRKKKYLDIENPKVRFALDSSIGEKIDEIKENLEENVDNSGWDIQKAIGLKETASKLIEETQNDIKEPRDINADNITRIIAIRQLSNARYGKSGNLDSTVLSEAEIDERTEALLNNDVYVDFLKSLQDNPGEELNEDDRYELKTSILTDGHGGKLEKLLDAFVKKQPENTELPDELFKRYKSDNVKKIDLDEYIKNNTKDYTDKKGKVKIKADDDAAASRAAGMLAAYTIKDRGERPLASHLENLKKKILESDEFKFIRRHQPQGLNLITKGDFDGYFDFLGKEMGVAKPDKQIKNQPEADADKEAENKELFEKYRDNEANTIYAALTTGSQLGTAKEIESHRKYKAERSKALNDFAYIADDKVMIDAHKDSNSTLESMQRITTNYFLVDKKGDAVFSNDKIRPNEMDELVLNITNHQAALELAKENNKKLKAPEKAVYEKRTDKLLNGVAVLVAAADKYTNAPKGLEGKELEEYKQNSAKELLNAVKLYTNAYSEAYKKALDSYVKKNISPDAKEMKGFTNQKDILKLDKDKDAQPYLERRGPRYKKMVEALKAYNLADKSLPQPGKTMRLIDAILDYQNGREKLMKGDSKIRFDNSMRLLATVTVNSPFEKYLDEQIAKINKVRGAKPGSKGFITKADYYNSFKNERNRSKGLSEIKDDFEVEEAAKTNIKADAKDKKSAEKSKPSKLSRQWI